MRRILPILLLSSALGCSSSPEGEENAESAADAGSDAPVATAPADMGSQDASGTSDADDTQPDASALDMPDEFEFGFEPEPLLIGLEGPQPASVTWNGGETEAEFLLLLDEEDIVGTLSFEAGGDQFTYRLGGAITPMDEIRLDVTERNCLAGDSICGELPAELVDAPVYRTVARYDGSQIVFAPFEIIPDATSAAPDFDFRAPGDVIMVPNDGFKPADVPDLSGNWEGTISFFETGSALSGRRDCALEFTGPFEAPQITSMSCGTDTFEIDGDPGPVGDSLVFDDGDYVVEIDFADAGGLWTLGGQLGDGEFVGILLAAERADVLTSPLDADYTDIRGHFSFVKTQ